MKELCVLGPLVQGLGFGVEEVGVRDSEMWVEGLEESMNHTVEYGPSIKSQLFSQ